MKPNLWGLLIIAALLLCINCWGAWGYTVIEYTPRAANDPDAAVEIIKRSLKDATWVTKSTIKANKLSFSCGSHPVDYNQVSFMKIATGPGDILHGGTDYYVTLYSAKKDPIEIQFVSESSAKSFMDAVETLKQWNLIQAKPVQPTEEKTALTLEEKLKNLKDLYDKGLISKEEYDERRKKILDDEINK